MSTITLVLYAIAIYVEDYEIDKVHHDEPGPAKALAFVALTTMQLLHSFLARSVKESVFSRNIFSNGWLWMGCSLSIVLLVAGCYVPGLNTLLNQWELDAFDWLKILICVMIHVTVLEISKIFLRRQMRKSKKNQATKNLLFYNDL
jgi:magnesium-transporting ATPase (P-type)